MDKPEKYPILTFPILVENELTNKKERQNFTLYFPAQPVEFFRGHTLYEDGENYNTTSVMLADGTELISAWSYDTFCKNVVPYIEYHYSKSFIEIPEDNG